MELREEGKGLGDRARKNDDKLRWIPKKRNFNRTDKVTTKYFEPLIVLTRRSTHLYNWFMDRLLPCVTGKDKWNRLSHKLLPSELATESDEAYCLAELVNCMEEWLAIAHGAKDGDKLPPRRFSNKKENNGKKYEGWHRKGIEFYNNKFFQVQEDRQRYKSFDKQYLLYRQKNPLHKDGLVIQHQGTLVANGIDDYNIKVDKEIVDNTMKALFGEDENGAYVGIAGDEEWDLDGMEDLRRYEQV